MGVYAQIKTAFQDIIATERHAIRGDLRGMRGEIQGLHAEIRRLDQKVDGVDRELRTATDIRERLAALEARRSA